MIKLLLKLTSISPLITSCATSTGTANLGEFTGEVASVGVAIAEKRSLLGLPGVSGVDHQIALEGVLNCEGSNFFNFKSIQLELYYDKNIVAILPIDSFGNFKSIVRSEVGRHSLKAVKKNTGIVLDEETFISSLKQDRFNLNLDVCSK